MTNGQSDKCRWWIATIPEPEFSPESRLPNWCGYAKGQLEEAPTTGYKHWQCVFWCKLPQRLGRFKREWPTAFFEPTRSKSAIDYVWKEDTRVPDTQFELGTFPLKRNSKHDWKEIKSAAQAGRLDAIPEDIYVRHYSTLKRIVTNPNLGSGPFTTSCN